MNRCAVITGASRGIGKATAELFLELGYRVINVSRSSCDIDQVVNISVDMMAPGWETGCGEPLLAAVGDPESLVLIHNAALLEKDTIDDVNTDAMRRVMELNVVAPVVLHQLLRHKMQAGSSLIYVSSTLGKKAVSNSCSYVTSKHALIGLMKSTCQDMAGTGIHTVAVCPGFTDTEMLRSHIGHAPEVEQSIAAEVTMGRLIDPSEIASTIAFCAHNPVLNGAVLDANLGQVEH